MTVIASTAWSYWRWGWAGAWAVLGALFDPSIVLGLVPLAFLLGAVRLAVVSAVRALLRGSVRPSS
jgi:hypothetical protein